MSKQINLSSAVGGGSVGFAHNNPTEDHTITLPNETIEMPMMRLLTSQDTTSGTFKEFTIPYWAKRITIIFKGVSTSGTGNHVLVQIGSGTILTSGYLGSSSSGGTYVNYTNGFGNRLFDVPSASVHGSLKIEKLSGNTFVGNGNFARSDAAIVGIVAGSVVLPGTLDIIRITTVNGTDIFDAGTVNVLVEGY